METLGTLFDLIPHPLHPPRAIATVSGSMILQSAGKWNVGFTVAGQIDRLRLADPATPQRKDELWRSTCFELFLRDPATGAYLEFNLSPSGEWAAYGFDRYRDGMRNLEVDPIRVTSSDSRQFALGMRAHLIGLGLSETDVDAMLAAEAGTLPQPPADRYVLNGVLDDNALALGTSLEVGICAVIEETNGAKSYWALAHPPGKPDFHDPACFKAILAPPGVA